jgi:hypothetical protein
MAHSKCACGSDLVAFWDPVDEIWRIKCDGLWHTSRERDPLESLLVGKPPGTSPMTPSEYAKALCMADEEDGE